MPLKPQREGDRLLIGLPARAAGPAYPLQLVYAAPVETVALRGTMKIGCACSCLLRADRQADAVEVPLADLAWTVRLPSGYEATWAGGTLATDDLPRPEPAAVTVIDVIYWLAGGVHTGGWLFPSAGSHSQVKSAARAGIAIASARSAAAVQRIEQEAKLDDETNDQDPSPTTL